MTALHYILHTSTNSRPPLILIHGAGGSFLSWHPHLRRLDGETVFTLDLSGHGKSAGPGRQTIKGYAEDVLAFIRENNIQKPVVVGHSMGSAIALTLALNHPNQFSGLALLGAGAKLRVSPLILEKAKNPQTFAEAVQLVNEYSFRPGAPKDLLRLSNETMLQTNPQILLGDFLACDSFDVIERLNMLQTPTLIVCGLLDVMAPPKFSKFLYEKIPNARLHLLEETGHMLTLEQPDAVADLLKSFLDELPPQP
ncbi:MAG: alpha/beta hydrolase [Chloroflexi bacterium]|nr:alpha/beta hydrolase [Chloroflexota bacterium]